jgi:hypothetical protein
MKTHLSLFALAALLSACASTPPADPTHILPEQAVMRAAQAAPSGIVGVFDMRVKSTGSQNGIVFLNSENDYRDQRNLTIEITPEAAQALSERLGASPTDALKGKHVLVNGAAKRVTIAFYNDGKQSDKYYYQTHVKVDKADQVRVTE